MSLDLDDLLAFDRLARDLDFADDVLDGKGRTERHGGAGAVEGGGFGEAPVLAVGVDDVAVKIGQEHRRAAVEQLQGLGRVSGIRRRVKDIAGLSPGRFARVIGGFIAQQGDRVGGGPG